MVLATYLVNETMKEYVYLSLYEAEEIGSTLGRLDARWNIRGDTIVIWHTYREYLNHYILVTF